MGRPATFTSSRIGASPVVLVGIVLNVLAALVLLFASAVGEPRGYCYSWTEGPEGRRTYGPAHPDGPGDPGQGSGAGCTSDVVTPAAVALAVGVRLPGAPAARPSRG